MFTINPLLKADAYKQTHYDQYPDGITKLVSYATPRKARVKYLDKMSVFGIQAFCIQYLIDDFNENFFNRPRKEVEEELKHYLDGALGEGNYNQEKNMALYDLGYLPLKISILPEGEEVPMGVPIVEITNTHPDFAWLVQWIESLMSAEIWKPCAFASIARKYREVANEFYKKTVDDAISPCKAMSNFDFRGMSNFDEACKTTAAWLTCFSSTSTIPAMKYLEHYYDCDTVKENICKSAISTEHSVMAANYAVDCDEVTFIKKLLTQIYPNSSFSMVSDTYDYWNIINNILPTIKEDIKAHEGRFLIRPDSGDIVEISVETVTALATIFGTHKNTKGYKVINDDIGVIYGDGVTIERARAIYTALEERGFAANNIVFGVGSFSFNAIEEDGQIYPLTRDTFNFALKATYAEINDKSIQIFKDPKTDKDCFKKSKRGCCKVLKNEKGEYVCEDGFTYDETLIDLNNCFVTLFEDGIVYSVDSFNNIRVRMNGGKSFI